MLFCKCSIVLVIFATYYIKIASASNSEQSTGIVQAAGHANTFIKGARIGTVLKKSYGNEANCYKAIEKDDPIIPFVPKFYRTTKLVKDGEEYIEMQNLLFGFKNPSVMDIKIGTRTFREIDFEQPRNDLYNKMLELDPNEPTDEERKAEAITKSRYINWRDSSTSTQTLGFRIAGLNIEGRPKMNKEILNTMKDPKEIKKIINEFAPTLELKRDFLIRLLGIGMAAMVSPFFRTHQFVGSSLLFVQDNRKANIWLVDFAQTYRIPQYERVTHNRNWQKGNYEDGYFIGLNNLTKMFQQLFDEERDSNLHISTKIENSENSKESSTLSINDDDLRKNNYNVPSFSLKKSSLLKDAHSKFNY